jgi:hypothetical protein
VGFEPTISAGERPQTYALDRAATGTGTFVHLVIHILETGIRSDVLAPQKLYNVNPKKCTF